MTYTEVLPQVQFGIYGVAGFDLRTNVKSIIWESIDAIPTSQTLTPEPTPTPAPTTCITCTCGKKIRVSISVTTTDDDVDIIYE